MKPEHSQMHDVSMTKDRSLYKQHRMHMVTADFRG
jgi:hypothetical protein